MVKRVTLYFLKSLMIYFTKEGNKLMLKTPLKDIYRCNQDDTTREIKNHKFKIRQIFSYNVAYKSKRIILGLCSDSKRKQTIILFC